MTPLLVVYLTSYSVACAVAVFLMFGERGTLVLFRPRYRRFLLSRWKLTTFIIAATALTVIAPYTGDPTWDYADAAFMSLMTYLTAPWSVGTLYLALHRRANPIHAYIAVCVWMFSVSWAYDVYMLLKLGYYPPTWVPNIVLSSILYFSAGLMWNLQYKDGRGVVFGFMEAGWPNPDYDLGIRQIIWFAVPIMLLATAMIAPFALNAIT